MVYSLTNTRVLSYGLQWVDQNVRVEEGWGGEAGVAGSSVRRGCAWRRFGAAADCGESEEATEPRDSGRQTALDNH